MKLKANLEENHFDFLILGRRVSSRHADNQNSNNFLLGESARKCKNCKKKKRGEEGIHIQQVKNRKKYKQRNEGSLCVPSSPHFDLGRRVVV